MNTIFVVFTLPLTRPGEREFLAAYSSYDRAQQLIDAQDPSVQPQMTISEIIVDCHQGLDDFWKLPPG